MTRKLLIGVGFALLLCSSGCWDLQEINDKAVTTAIGIDWEADNRISFSSLYISPTVAGEVGEAAQTNPTITVGRDHSVALAARKMMLSFSKVPEFAHIRSLVLGDNLVSNNLNQSVDFMTRNRNISEVMNLLVSVDSSPEEILALINNTDRSLKSLVPINELESGIYMPVTIADFTYKLFTPGIEATIPQIIIAKPHKNFSSDLTQTEDPAGDKKKLALNGTAVFKKNRKIGFLDEYESRGLRWLNSQNKIGGLLTIESPVKPDHSAALEVLRFTSKTRPQINGNTIIMQIHIKTRLALSEHTGSIDNVTVDVLKKMEQEANREISRQINSCIHKSQSLNSDILGWGLMLLRYHPDIWKQVKGDWYNWFPEVKYVVQVESSIIHTYLAK